MSPLNRKQLNHKNLIVRFYYLLVLERDIRDESLLNFSASKYFSKLVRVKIFILLIFSLKFVN